MHDDVNDPAAVPAHDETRTAARWPAALLLGIGGGVGLALGIVLTVSVTATYSLFTPTIRPNRDWVQVFDELNELRQQVNRMNEERNLKDQETVAAIRQALSTVASTARPGNSGTPGAVAPAHQQSGGADRPRVARAWDPLAEVDEEIKRLEETQRVLNTILDMFTPKNKERTKDRSGAREPPE
jgi:uncharacterized protein YdcH (DUF465 family)